jgi:hypothetical protein
MLGIGRITVLLFPFSKIKQRIEKNLNKQKSNKSMDKKYDRVMAEIEIIKWSVTVMSRYTPWRSNCFAQSLAAQKMLSRRGISSTIHFGIAIDDERTMAAHAWLMYKDTVITGEREKRRFNAIMQIGCESQIDTGRR